MDLITRIMGMMEMTDISEIILATLLISTLTGILGGYTRIPYFLTGFVAGGFITI